MNSLKETLRKAVEYILPWLVLAFLLTYTYAKFFEHRYGMRWLSDGIVSNVFVNEREPTIHEGDRLIKVGSVDFQSFASDLRKDLFDDARAGDILSIIVERGGQTQTVEWQVPGTNAGEIRDQLFSQWFLAYFFWIAGTATFLLLRPRDTRWLLLGLFNYLTSIWLLAGSGLSAFHIWDAALVLRVAIWISVPMNLHLHWVFPRPLGKLPLPLLWVSYAIGGGLVIAQWFQLVPSSAYFLGFLAAVGGSLMLLVVHVVRQPGQRRDLRLVLIAAVFAVVPSLTLGVVGALRGSVAPVATLALLSFPILPFAYLYAAYRRQLGDLELRVNRVISLYSFLILLGAIVVPLLVAIDRLPLYSPDQALITSVVASVVVTAVSLWGYPLFQGFVERRVLGIAVPSKELQQAYSAHITSSTSFADLTRLLQDEVVPSLLVRQFVFLVFDEQFTRVVLSQGVTQEQIPMERARTLLRPLIGKNPVRGLSDDPRFSWILLVLPLTIEQELLGFWLFGRRDPDDVYSSLEVPVLQSFANQAAIALSNILQTERLRAMYQADINRHENERLRLARELHDSVLSELAGMLMNADIASLPGNFQTGYKALTQRLREIVSELRPPMLNYGLEPALDDLADSLMERGKDSMEVVVDLQSNNDRYPPDKERHLYRIVQEACENAVRHSRCSKITVSGQLSADRVVLSIEDDGDGFQLSKQDIDLHDLLSERHFGLAGMFERAELIDADIRIGSSPGDGTRITVIWPRHRRSETEP